MAVRILCVLVVALAGTALALDGMDNVGVRIAMRVFNECSSKAEGLSPCLKKKALTFLDRLGRMDKLDVTDEISIVKAPTAAINATPLTDDEIDKNLPRALDDRDEALTTMLWNKVTSLVRSKNIEFTMPRMSDIGFEEARKGSLDLGGKKKIGHGGHGKHMMMGMMMGMMGKMMGLIPAGIAGLFLLAGKALITSKIALMIAGIIAIKKLIASKNGGGGGGHGGGYGGGHGGGHHIWASGGGGGGGGGWDRRSLDDSQKLAYSSYAPH